MPKKGMQKPESYTLHHSYTLTLRKRKPLVLNLEEKSVEALAQEHAEHFRALFAEHGAATGVRLDIYRNAKDWRRVTGKRGTPDKHNAVMRQLAKLLAKDGISMTLVPMDADKYLAWLEGRESTRGTIMGYLWRDDDQRGIIKL